MFRHTTKTQKTAGKWVISSHLSSPTVLAIDYELQKALLLGIELLGISRHSHCDEKTFRQLADDIAKLAKWMSFLFGQRELVIIEGSRSKPDTVQFAMRPVCHKCKDANTQHLGNIINQELKPLEPCWSRQIEFLLSCTRTVGIEMFQHCIPPSTLRGFPECLDRLVAVLQRQQQIMQSVMGDQIGVEFEFARPDICAECGEAIEVKDYAR